MSLAGMCVALSAALVYDKKTVVLSVLGTYFNGMVVDHFIFGQNLKRREYVLLQSMKKNFGILFCMSYIVEQPFMMPSERTI